MNKRNLKVEEHTFKNMYSAGTGARIRLKGKWLEEAGFSPGDRVTVKVEQKKLVIEKETE